MIIEYTQEEKRKLEELKKSYSQIDENYTATMQEARKLPDFSAQEAALTYFFVSERTKIEFQIHQAEAKAWKRVFSKLGNDPEIILQNAREQVPAVISRVVEDGQPFINMLPKRRYIWIPLVTYWISIHMHLHRNFLKKHAPDRLPELDAVIVKAIKSDDRFSLEADRFTEQEVAERLWQGISHLEEYAAVSTVFPQSFLMASDKITRTAFDNTFTPDPVGVRIEGRKSKKPITTIVSVDFEALDGSIEIKRELTHYDRAVQDAVLTLYASGNEYLTSQMIYQTMTGNPHAKLNPKQAKDLHTSLTKMMYTRVVINASDEAKYYRNLQKLQFDSPLLPAQRITAQINGNEVECLHITAMPPLYQYAAQKNQIGRLENIRLLNTPINKTSEILVLQHYLLERVTLMKSNSLPTTILYEAVYKHLGIDAETPGAERKKKAKVREQVKIILESWKENGLITSFRETKKKQAVYSVIINPKEKEVGG